MDLGSILIGVAFMAICISPFLITYINNTKKSKNILLSLKNLANENQCQITKYECSGNISIGMDEIRNKLFFVKQSDNEAIFREIDLKQVRVCLANIVTRSVKGSSGVISLVELNFLNHSKQPDFTIELYNEQQNTITNGEPLLSKKWSEIINNKIKQLI
ncbi:hypothetical protein KO566_00235 [Flavobacteriaceae bacterium XHP0103]|uniref:hypothetical protein n=1 Tax=Marixanthotalea marina TaxID=2844359 RepID=UPI002989D1B2|nr:hypothetical protein [Marixanthotalea marina]MBU3820472.1 hypothetical protein [Marixanthotalea marina]